MQLVELWLFKHHWLLIVFNFEKFPNFLVCQIEHPKNTVQEKITFNLEITDIPLTFHIPS